MTTPNPNPRPQPEPETTGQPPAAPTEEQRGGEPAQEVTPAELDELFGQPEPQQHDKPDEEPTEVTLAKRRRWGRRGKRVRG